MATYSVDVTPTGRKRRKVRVVATSEHEARQKAIARIYGAKSRGTRSFQVHNVVRVGR